MQTFLPLPDYAESMRCLDKSRLGNQVWREGLTLIRGGWPNHPAAKMWKNHEHQLGLYLLAGIQILKERGRYYRDIEKKILVEMNRFRNNGWPKWLGDNRLHASHRSNLLRKNPVWYAQFGWTEPNNIDYYWPVG